MPKERQYAARHGKEVLYKFRPYKSETDKSRVREIIQDDQIYFSKRSQLNDPFDLAPVIRLDHADPDLRKKLMDDAQVVWRRNEPEISQREITRRLAVIASRDLSLFEANSRQLALDRIESECSVFSLAGNCEHPMLWSHYAGNHSGICLFFDSRESSVFGTAQRVQYREARPYVAFPFDEDTEAMIDRSTLWKGSFWEYEDEYRVIRYGSTQVYEGAGLEFDGQYGLYPPELLVGVAVGICMQPAEVREILELAGTHKPNMAVWRAVDDLTYTMRLERIG